MCVATFLDNAGLSSYIGAFIAQGITTMSDVQLLSDSDLRELGINTIGERNRFKQHLRAVHSCSSTSATSTNSSTTNYQPPIYGGSVRTATAYSYVSPSEYRHVTPPKTRETKPTGPDASARAKFNQVFNAIDADDSGEIDIEEFIVALKKMDMYRSDIDAIRIFNQGDGDDNGTLDRDEFIQMLHLASSDGRGSRLSEMAKAGKDVLEKLKASQGISFTIEDVVDAPITDSALETATKYSNNESSLNSMVPSFASCNETNCNLFFNLLVVNSELAHKLVEAVCLAMLEDLENKLRECGISDFVSKCVRVEGVVNDAIRYFIDIIHRYSHLTREDKTYLDSKTGLAFIHSFRKAACVVAADKSVDEVRQYAINILEDQSKRSGSSSSILGAVGRGLASGGGAVLAEELLLPAVVGAAGCTIM